MSTITIFTAPKPFLDPHINTIQRNAVRSWKVLGPDVEVILIGDEPGLSQAARDLDVRQISEVERNHQGTPLVHSIFDLARRETTNDLLFYLNADIILLPDCIPIINSIHQIQKEFLLVGRRWDLNITQEIEFDKDGLDKLRETLANEGRKRTPAAMDYFVFPRHLYREIPPFAVGRAGWDNWMIYYAIQQPWPVIDATSSLQVIHQNHDYSHLPDGKPHFELDESSQNIALSGGMTTLYDILDVDFAFRKGRIVTKRLSLDRLLRKLERLVMPDSQEGWRWFLTRRLRKLNKRLLKAGR